MRSKKLYIFFLFICLAVVIYFQYSKDTHQKKDNTQVENLEEAKLKEKSKLSDQPVVVEDKVTRDAKVQLPEPQLVDAQDAVLSKEEIKSLRQQVKASLASGYTSMVAYRAEWDRYTTDFHAAGWMPSGNAELKFKIGFLESFMPNSANKEYTSAENPERMSTDSFMDLPVYNDDPEGPKFSYSKYSKDINLSDYRNFCRRNCTASLDEFEIIAVIPLGANRFDVWTVNNQKVIQQVQDGLESP